MQAAGVLLACDDANASTAAILAVATSLDPSCGHCLHRFDMPALAAPKSPSERQELAGQAQKALVLLLQRCQHAVILIEGIESMPPQLLPVFIHALSEHGHFEDSGNQVSAYKALVIATVVMPTKDLLQVRTLLPLTGCMLHASERRCTTTKQKGCTTTKRILLFDAAVCAKVPGEPVLRMT